MNILWQQKLCNLQQLKNRSFHVPQPTFLFLLETPLRLSRNNRTRQFFIVIFVRVSWANFVNFIHSKGNIAQQETKQLFLSSRKYLFNSQIASAIDSVNQIFYEYDSSDISAYAVRYFWTDCHTRNGVHVWAIFIARQHTDARYWYSNSVRPSVCLSVRPSVFP